MNILFILEYYFPNVGGAEIVFKNLAERLVRKGHSVSIVTCKLPGTERYEEINGVKVYRVKVPQKGDRYWFTLLSLLRAFKVAKKCDIIHTTTYTGAVPSYITSMIYRKKTVITVHEVFGSMWKNLSRMNWISANSHKLLERGILSLPFDKYVCVSCYTRNSLRLYGIKDAKLKVIYNGIDTNLFDPQKYDGTKIRKRLKLGKEFVYLFYGRPGISKGVEYLVEAVLLIKKTIPNSKLMLILSKKPKEGYDQIIQLIKRLGLEQDIILLDSVPTPELPCYIKASDCVVVPSLSEGFGFSAAESCAMNKSVVATNVGALPEVVYGNYVLVEPRNPQEIFKAINLVYKKKSLQKEKMIFDWDKNVDEYLKVYEEVLR